MENDFTQFKEGRVAPWYQRRWWLRVREVEPVRYPDGSIGGCAEFYVPWWARPLDYVHGLVFGHPKVELSR